MRAAAWSAASRRSSSSGYTLAAFQGDLDKVRASGVVPLCLGGKDRFTTVELFENTLLNSIGGRGWKDMVDDELDWRGGAGGDGAEALRRVAAPHRPAGERVDLGRRDEEARLWRLRVRIDERLRLRRAHRRWCEEGEDFGATAFPGTGDSFLAVVDVFVAATKATAHQRVSSKALWTSPVLLSIAHGETMSPEFQEGFYDAVSTYVRTRSADAFADDLEDAVSEDKIPQR
jgi:glucose/mannose transport system substrate-binding protein